MLLVRNERTAWRLLEVGGECVVGVGSSFDLLEEDGSQIALVLLSSYSHTFSGKKSWWGLGKGIMGGLSSLLP